MTVLSLLPIVCLLVCLIVIKLSVVKSGTISLVLALVIALGFYGLPALGLAVATGKALWLALFVSLIVWGALFLYHLVSDFKAIDVINKNITIFVKDKFVAFLLLAWLFTGLLQGMAGFGVPPVIVTPILIALGFGPVKSLAASLLGHSWAVTFGSMGAAFFVISYLTGIPPEDLGIPMWIFNTVAHLLTGLGVCFLYDGLKGINKGLSYVLPVSAVMAVVQFITITLGMFPLAGLLTALAGLITMFLLYKLRSNTKEKNKLYKGDLTLLQSVLPYATIIVLAIMFAFLPQYLPESVRDPSQSFAFPGFETSPRFETLQEQVGEGAHSVAAEEGYMPIRLFRHPVVLLLFASVVAIVIYKRAGLWSPELFRGAAKKTIQKGIPATLALLALGTMSLIMMDSGMTHQLAYAVAGVTQGAYPVFAPFFGVLASFLTGNNTNSNVLFGLFQYAAAERLGVSTAIMTAAQSISGSVGVAIGPTLVLMGAIASNQKGQESLILKKLIPLVLLIALVMGIVNFGMMNYI
jgi:lactate permease